MNKLLSVFSLILFLFEANSQNNPTNGLIAYYNFNLNHSNISIIPDESKNSNDGMYIGQPEYATDRFNQDCAALNFDGNSYVSIPDSKSLKSPKKQITIAVWFKLKSGADLFKQWITICCKSDISAELKNSPQYRMQATAQTISLNSDFTENAIPQLSYDKWYFYAYTFDGKRCKAYLNDKYFFEMDYSTPFEKNDMPLEIGRDLPGQTEYFLGTMDELRIYNRALTESELNTLYTDSSDNNGQDKCLDPSVANQVSNVPSTGTYPLNSSTVLGPPITQGKYSSLPESVDAEPVKYQHIVQVKKQDVTIYFYDNKKDDGDIVSVNLNGEWVIENYTLKPKSSPAPVEAVVRFHLKNGSDNFLVSRALNEGNIPPNTMTVLIDDGVSQQSIVIDSKLGLSGGIKLVVK